MKRWLATAAVLTLAACGQTGSPSAQSSKTVSPSTTMPPATSGGTPAATNRAVDSYPSAPQVTSAFVGNGVYGNAFLLSGTDAWYWDGAVWHHTNAHMLDSPHTPPVYDPVLKKSVVLTNGETGMPVNTWAWSGTSWSSLSATLPGETGPSLLGYHAGAQQLIAVVNATWRYGGSNWVAAGGLDSPQTRRGTSLVYDPLNRQLLLFGGVSYQGSGALADTWTWDGNGWTLRHPGTNPPAGWASLAYDPDSGHILLLDQQMDAHLAPTSLTMWSWDGVDWHQLHPSALPSIGLSPGMTYDLANHQLIYFESLLQTGPNGAGGSQTWIYTNGNWVRAG